MPSPGWPFTQWPVQYLGGQLRASETQTFPARMRSGRLSRLRKDNTELGDRRGALHDTRPSN
jgi:hypothetical protein